MPPQGGGEAIRSKEPVDRSEVFPWSATRRRRYTGGEVLLAALLDQWQNGYREPVMDELTQGHPLLTVDFIRSEIFDHDPDGLNHLANGLIARRRSRQ
jgi:hypothetical protein